MADQKWVGVNQGSSAWAEAAYEILTETASHYLGLITQAELAEQVQDRAGIYTRAPFRSWIGGVLAKVVAQCRVNKVPPLTSLVVQRAGGDIDTTQSTINARLTCYRHFADDVPLEIIAVAEEAARAAERAEADASRERSSRQRSPRTTTSRPRKRATPEEAPKICPTCFMQLPASGICDNCG